MLGRFHSTRSIAVNENPPAPFAVDAGAARQYIGLMNVRITHCTVCWGYRDRALALAKELRRRFGANVEVEGGGPGRFDVYVDGEVVASRGQSLLSRLKPGRPPSVSTVIATIERHLPKSGGSAARS